MVFLIKMLNTFDFLNKNLFYVVYSNINTNKSNNLFKHYARNDMY